MLTRGVAASTTVAYGIFNLPNMRAVPSLTATAADWELRDHISVTQALTGLAFGTGSNQYARLSFTVGSGLTAKESYLFKADSSAGRYLIFSAEVF